MKLSRFGSLSGIAKIAGILVLGLELSGCAIFQQPEAVEYESVRPTWASPRTNPARIMNRISGESLIKQGYYPLGRLTVTFITKDANKDVPHAYTLNAFLAMEAAARGADLVWLEEDNIKRVTSRLRQGGCTHWSDKTRLVRRQVCEGAPIRCSFQTVAERICNSYETYSIATETVRSQGSIWRYDPEGLKADRELRSEFRNELIRGMEGFPPNTIFLPGGLRDCRIGQTFSAACRRFAQSGRVGDTGDNSYIFSHNSIFVRFSGNDLKNDGTIFKIIFRFQDVRTYGRNEKLTPFPGRTTRGIGLNSTPEDVVNAYGKADAAYWDVIFSGKPDPFGEYKLEYKRYKTIFVFRNANRGLASKEVMDWRLASIEVMESMDRRGY